MVAFGVALIYSLYIELPFSNSYIQTDSSDLVTSGTYALCRHPGVLWYFFFAFGLVLASSHSWAGVAAAVWPFMNLFFAWIQDRFYFPRIFPDYKKYKTTTPFLIPTFASIKQFRGSLKI
ncbi:MAG: hypothetical protein DWQ07_12190 [Chloroflexi bacterium]|nr:MAG: hypothetical protein DWQ07_12190 [Chloroflexota bacterium]